MSILRNQLKFAEPSSEVPFPSFVKERPELVVNWLEQFFECPVAVKFTNNRSTMMSWRREKGTLRIRLHQLFVNAPEPIWISLAHYWAHEDPASGGIIDAYISDNLPDYKRESPTVNGVGKHHDLLQLFDALNERFFHNRCRIQITWGKPGRSRTGVRSRKSIQLGAYIDSDKLIRIHPCLDQRFVPNYYVAWVIFHEMLHEVLGVEQVNGRRQTHPPEFIALEESFPDFERCKEWEKRHLGRLLKFRPG